MAPTRAYSRAALLIESDLAITATSRARTAALNDETVMIDRRRPWLGLCPVRQPAWVTALQWIALAP
jgi:hypothetical protein